MNESLLPCPFCGGEAWLNEIIAERDKDSDRYIVMCTNCVGQSNTYIYKQDAIDSWNNRSTGWISVDTPPNTEPTVPLLVTDGKRMYVTTYYKDGSDSCEYSDCCGCKTDGITHYQYLPEPPKDEDKE